ncbi:MAG: hypothetical protein R3C97_16575 [Geminicoccaceae bacterium]
MTPEIVAENREVVDEIISDFDFESYAEAGWNEKQKVPAFSDTIKLADLLPRIGQLRYMARRQPAAFRTLLGLERLANEEPDMPCSFYALRAMVGVEAVRTLGDTSPPKVKNLFQGKNDPTNYPAPERCFCGNDHLPIAPLRYSRHPTRNGRYGTCRSSLFMFLII